MSQLKHPIKILLLGTQMAVGGAQKVLFDQATWFHQRGYKVTTAFFYDRDDLHSSWRDSSPFPVTNLNAFEKGQGGLRNGVLILRGLWRLWILLRREKFDVIETFTHDSNMLALPLAWAARTPVRIATHHGIVAGISLWREKIHAWMVNHGVAQRIVAVSTMTRKKLLEEGIHEERIVVIPNGITPVAVEGINKVEVRKAAGIGADDPFLLAVGRLVYSKAHELLIAAMPSVLEKFPNAKLGICGDGVLRPQLEEQIQFIGLSTSVKLLGHSDNVAKFLASADVFVMPSLWEGLPIALLEAMSAGLPVIATQVEGIEEAVVEGENGCLIPIGDAKALAEAIIHLLADTEMQKRMGRASQEKVKKTYSSERMCKEYFDLVREIVQKEPQK